MKELIRTLQVVVLLMALTNICRGQEGLVNTLANVGNAPIGICQDDAGNTFVAQWDAHYIKRIDAVTGAISIVAGTGQGGFSGDGGLGVNAMVEDPWGVFADHAGNVYFTDRANNRVRKIDALTNIITTVAGNGQSNFSGDGGLAINAGISAPHGIYVDASSNLYITSEGRIRKVDGLTGIISTICGIGFGFSGDGGLAINAGISSNADGIAMDAAGNIFFADCGNARVRRIDGVSGIITTVAGGGQQQVNNGDGGLAINANLDGPYATGPRAVWLDLYGNLYIADNSHKQIRKVNTVTGIISTLAGGGNNTLDGVPALSSDIHPEYGCEDKYNNIVFADYYSGRIRKLSVPGLHLADSFLVSVNSTCTGVVLIVKTNNYSAGMHVKTFFGDNEVTDVSISNVNNSGQAIVNHSYAITGIYTVKQVLYNGAIKIDSVSYTYENVICSTISIQFYADANATCAKDSGEASIQQPMLVQVDSNNVSIDTLSVMSGFYHTAYGNAGDVYKYKVISAPTGMQITCPANGTITTTLQAANIATTQYMGFACINGNNFDLSAEAVIPVTGIHDQWGNIYVRNNYCMPTNATVTLNFSPKYVYNAGWANPAPSSTAATSITWNLSSLSSNDISPTSIYYVIWNNPATGSLTVNDTVQEHIVVTPMVGDMDASNNIIIHDDTVKGSCDPNLIEVTPKGHIPAGTQLRYQIEFENVGNDTAFNIYVLDTLPNELDANSLRLVSSTHAMYVSKLEDGTHTIMKFDFPHINLLDSSHHDACTGTFTYTINTKTGLPYGTHIDHAAGIYFDDNGVVETNTAENIIGWPMGVTNVSNNNKVQVYPNPANNELNIKQTGTDYTSFTISNSIGQAVMEQQLDKEAKVNIKMLPAGVYYITLKGGKGNEVRKFVKM